MKVLFVVNNFYASGNGLSASARRTVKYLKKAGIDVKTLSGPNHDNPDLQPDFVLKDFHIPVFDRLVTSNGYCFAKTDRDVITKAVEWADIVHLEEPFMIEYETAKIAEKLHTPCVGTYHLHPENIFCAIHLDGWRLLNNSLLRLWRDLVFDKCSDLQCPTENVQKRLRKFGFKSRLHLISNGIIPDEALSMRPADDGKRPILVACIGRLSVEKDQPTLLKAMLYSRHADRIQLYFAGRGPEEANFHKMAFDMYDRGEIKLRPIFAFHTRDELRQLAATADICIHCANVEVEGLSILEALQQGVAPVIAESDLSAASTFALDDRSRFKAKDPEDLAAKIDWWIEHPKEREEVEDKYIEHAATFDIHRSIDALIKMYEKSLAEAGKTA